MGTIAVSIGGKPKFTWHGDEAKIAETRLNAGDISKIDKAQIEIAAEKDPRGEQVLRLLHVV